MTNKDNSAKYQCKICGSELNLIFNRIVMKIYAVDYFHCQNCGFIQTEAPFWLNEAYCDVINTYDTGILARNISFSNFATNFLFYQFGKRSKFLDYGGGNGIFTRLMRDTGFDFYLYDPQCPNLFARGFEFNPEMNKITAITAWECFEHFEDPMEDLKKMVSISRNILFSTELLPEKIPNPETWSYYGFEHGQHISFYSHQTLEYLARKFDLNFYSQNNIHFFSENKMNNTIFKILWYSSHFGLDIIVKCALKSKTLEDMEGNKKLFNKS
ncbi:MAG TPA: methyltransferase type 11 [Bacteroidales bacterium]|nr:methyltransferase type 11 [Bacteroidales bacterium]